MEYVQDPFRYIGQPPPEQMFYQRVPYPGFPMHQPSPHHLEELYHRYPHQHADYSDFVPYQEEYDDPGEVSTRPRLTREQAEVLEAHFQANHKPNSMVKRQLAMQTKLTLPRVANWFQNRRAKAKQQKKQEEFESTQAQNQSTCPTAEEDPEDQTEEQAAPDERPHSQPQREESELQSEQFQDQDSQPPVEQVSAQQASWASLQRALRQAEIAKSQQQALSQSQMPDSMPRADQLQPQSNQLPIAAASCTQMMGNVGPRWQERNSHMDAWTPRQQFQDTGFDFGFDQVPQAEVSKDNMHQVAASTYAAPPPNSAACNAWQGCVPNAPAMVSNEIEVQYLGSPDLPLPPQYSVSRRGSAADSLTANFDTFALANESPRNVSSSTVQIAEPIAAPEVHLDIAARRNRPRPAALTSASLRSRSYGAATSMSPTFRTGMPMAPGMLRHVKSQGHSLNARFTGIRKPHSHSAQRSPINVSTFAEAETWDRLMAQQAAVAASSQVQGLHMDKVDSDALIPRSGPPVHNQLSPEDGQLLAHKHEQASRYQFPNAQHLTMSAVSVASPPITPYASEFSQTLQQLSVPPVSAPPQYANFPDYTPPYSAGPLTESSWSDAPLTSPEVTNNIPGVAYMQPMHPTHKMDSPHSHFQQFVLPSDTQSDGSYSISTPESKKTEFFIQEFPNQKEEHAHVAQQLSQSRPKNYVFANTAAGDYDHS